MGGLTSKPRLYFPDEKTQKTFNILKLHPNEIDQLFEIFSYVDRGLLSRFFSMLVAAEGRLINSGMWLCLVDGSGQLSLKEFFEHLDIKPSLFATKAFSVLLTGLTPLPFIAPDKA